jgi:hypothetical protein
VVSVPFPAVCVQHVMVVTAGVARRTCGDWCMSVTFGLTNQRLCQMRPRSLLRSSGLGDFDLRRCMVCCIRS